MNTSQNLFQALGVQPDLVAALSQINITTPTPVQTAALPVLLAGEDLLASAQTGTGKTIAYLLPILQQLLNSKTETALILAPTRELALQIKTSITGLLPKQSGIFTAVLIGGEAMPKQFAQLKRRPRIIVATPGRLNDHLQRKSVTLTNTRFLVLDETDRMLDMGFTPQLEAICQHLPQQRQTLMFSATMPKNIMQLSSKYLSNPQRIAIGQENKAVENIQQTVIKTPHKEKLPRLLEELESRNGSVIVFVKTKRSAEELAHTLSTSNHTAKAIHGDLKQSQRARVIQGFRNQSHRIMVATDVAARGLDVPHIQHVINFDLPQCPEDYIHRIGRTGRAGASGEAVCFVSPGETHLWKAIDRLMNPSSSNANANEENSRETAHFKPRKFSNNKRPSNKFGQSSSYKTDANKRSFSKSKKPAGAKKAAPNKSSLSNTFKQGFQKLVSKSFKRKQPA